MEVTKKMRLHWDRSFKPCNFSPFLFFLQVAVDVEYLRMEFILDFEVTEKKRIHWDKNCKEDASALPPTGAPCKWAWTTQQFYLERCGVHH